MARSASLIRQVHLFVAMGKDDCDSCGIWLQRDYSLLIAALSEENVWFDLQLMKRSHKRSMVGSFPNTIDGNGCNVSLPGKSPVVPIELAPNLQSHYTS
jgi:hypothetical protein